MASSDNGPPLAATPTWNGSRTEQFLTSLGDRREESMRLQHGGTFDHTANTALEDAYELGTPAPQIPACLKMDENTTDIDIDYSRRLLLTSELGKDFLLEGMDSFSHEMTALRNTKMPDNCMGLNLARGPGVLQCVVQFSPEEMLLESFDKKERVAGVRDKILARLLEVRPGLPLQSNTMPDLLCRTFQAAPAAALREALEMEGIKYIYHYQWGMKSRPDDYEHLDRASTRAHTAVLEAGDRPALPNMYDVSRTVKTPGLGVPFVWSYKTGRGNPGDDDNAVGQPGAQSMRTYPQVPGLFSTSRGSVQTRGVTVTVWEYVIKFTMYILLEHVVRSGGRFTFGLAKRVGRARENIAWVRRYLDKHDADKLATFKQIGEGLRMEARVEGKVTAREAVEVCKTHKILDATSAWDALGHFQIGAYTNPSTGVTTEGVKHYPISFVRPEVVVAHAMRVADCSFEEIKGRNTKATNKRMEQVAVDTYACIGRTKKGYRASNVKKLAQLGRRFWMYAAEKAAKQREVRRLEAASRIAGQPARRALPRRARGDAVSDQNPSVTANEQERLEAEPEQGGSEALGVEQAGGGVSGMGAVGEQPSPDGGSPDPNTDSAGPEDDASSSSGLENPFLHGGDSEDESYAPSDAGDQVAPVVSGHGTRTTISGVEQVDRGLSGDGSGDNDPSPQDGSNDFNPGHSQQVSGVLSNSAVGRQRLLAEDSEVGINNSRGDVEERQRSRVGESSDYMDRYGLENTEEGVSGEDGGYISSLPRDRSDDQDADRSEEVDELTSVRAVEDQLSSGGDSNVDINSRGDVKEQEHSSVGESSHSISRYGEHNTEEEISGGDGEYIGSLPENISDDLHTDRSEQVGEVRSVRVEVNPFLPVRNSGVEYNDHGDVEKDNLSGVELTLNARSDGQGRGEEVTCERGVDVDPSPKYSMDYLGGGRSAEIPKATAPCTLNDRGLESDNYDHQTDARIDEEEEEFVDTAERNETSVERMKNNALQCRPEMAEVDSYEPSLKSVVRSSTIVGDLRARVENASASESVQSERRLFSGGGSSDVGWASALRRESLKRRRRPIVSTSTQSHRQRVSDRTDATQAPSAPPGDAQEIDHMNVKQGDGNLRNIGVDGARVKGLSVVGAHNVGVVMGAHGTGIDRSSVSIPQNLAMDEMKRRVKIRSVNYFGQGMYRTWTTVSLAVGVKNGPGVRCASDEEAYLRIWELYGADWANRVLLNS